MNEPRNLSMEQKLIERIGKKHFLKLNSIKPICLFTVDSTQDYLSLNMKNDQEGDMVISETQTSGRGREGRKWISPKGGLWLSITLRPLSQIVERIPAMTINSILETLRDDYSISNLSIKVPNDLICGGKKIAGVLVDASVKGSYVVAHLGVGINVNNKIPKDSEIADIATSYVDEIGEKIPLEDFAFSFLVRLDRNYANLEKLANSTVREK